MHIAGAATTTLEDHLSAVFTGHIRDDLSALCFSDDGSFRNL